MQHRLPVTAGALHHHVPTALAFEPLSSAFQFRSNRAELLSSAVAFSAAGPVITQTARNFLPTSMPAHRSITAEIIRLLRLGLAGVYPYKLFCEPKLILGAFYAGRTRFIIGALTTITQNGSPAPATACIALAVFMFEGGPQAI